MNVIVPLNKKIVVMPEEKEKVTAGGVIIPETANQKAPTKGTIIAIADDSDLKLKLSPGDIILFSKYAGADVAIPGAKVGEKTQTILIIKDEDVLAVIEHRENKK
jgi:chaperonin GroES